ncbi:MAG: hypothetical protein KY391_00355 [Actinobacteria bacterium]|nr:hypothetical protein [Actinomycetota bacterium]
MRRTLAAVTYGWAPIRTRSIPLLGTPWTTLGGVLIVALFAHLALPTHVAAAILNPMGASVGIAAVAGLRRSTCRSAWNLLAAGVAAYAVADAVGLMSSIISLEQVAAGLYVASYAAFAGGFAAFVTRRR